MPFIDKLTIPVLIQNDAGYVVFLLKIAAHHKTLILEMLDFDPALGSLIKIIPTVTTLGYNILEILRFC